MNRYAQSPAVHAKAAALVNRDAVAYMGATSSGAAAFDVDGYRVTVDRAACRVQDCRCNCRWGQHGGRACSHVRAVRLAWHRAALDYAKRSRIARLTRAAAEAEAAAMGAALDVRGAA